MRIRALSLLAVAGMLLALALWPVQAGAKPSGRTAAATYSTPSVGAFGQGGFGQCSSEDGVGCAVFFTGPRDHRVSVKITDQSGQPVYATIVQSSGEPGGYDVQQGTQRGSFCGSTKKPVAIKGGQRVEIFVYEGPGPDGCPGVATQGRVEATFTR